MVLKKQKKRRLRRPTDGFRAMAKGDLYVVVSATDMGAYHRRKYRVKEPSRGPLVSETYLDRGASLVAARRRSQGLRQQYGPCRIARLTFIN